MKIYSYKFLVDYILDPAIPEDKGWDIAYDKIIESLPTLADASEEGIDVQFYNEPADDGLCKGKTGNSYLYTFHLALEVPDGIDPRKHLSDTYPELVEYLSADIEDIWELNY